MQYLYIFFSSGYTHRFWGNKFRNYNGRYAMPKKKPTTKPKQKQKKTNNKQKPKPNKHKKKGKKKARQT